MSAAPKPPAGLATRGKRTWKAMAGPDMAPEQVLLLEEICRSADRLEELDSIIQGKGVLELMQFRRMDRNGDGSDEEPVVIEVKFDSVLSEARQQQNVFKQLLVTSRQLAPGAKPQERGSRGSYDKSQPSPVKDEVSEKRVARGWRA